jgi:hypothetical protein
MGVLTFRYPFEPNVTPMTRSLQHQPYPAAGRWFRNTAGLPGELSVGDVVVVGEVALAVGRPAGWEPVRSALNEARADEHGTHPLRCPATPRAAGEHLSPEKEDHGE